MNTTTKPRRSGAKIMAQLIVLLGSLVYIMLLAVINGTAGFLCAMGVTLSGAAAIAKALGEEISFSYGALIALAVGCGVLRGLHFQKNHTQGKLVRVTMGEVYDVAVDCRPHSATFGKWVGVTLSEDNKKMFYIPEGFAHGFLVLSDVAEFCYKCTDVYDPTSEGGIPYDDPTVNVQWPDCGCEHKTSAKDKLHEPFAAQKFEFFEKW